MTREETFMSSTKIKDNSVSKGGGGFFVLEFPLRAACVTVKGAGFDPHVRCALIDMAESRSPRRAVPVDSRDRAWE